MCERRDSRTNNHVGFVQIWSEQPMKKYLFLPSKESCPSVDEARASIGRLYCTSVCASISPMDT
jgi:hypothetical protein